LEKSIPGLKVISGLSNLYDVSAAVLVHMFALPVDVLTFKMYLMVITGNASVVGILAVLIYLPCIHQGITPGTRRVSAGDREYYINSYIYLNKIRYSVVLVVEDVPVPARWI
jgi:hypothetical protein